MIFGHGDEGITPLSSEIVNFSTTVWTDGDKDHLEKHLVENLNCIRHYPEPDAGTLRQMLAKRNSVDNNAICNQRTHGGLLPNSTGFQREPKPHSHSFFCRI